MAESAFNEINEIQMSLQLAEHQLQHNPFQEQLHISLSLVSIARGSCKMIIRPDRQAAPSFVGALHIPADRAVMQATIALPQSHLMIWYKSCATRGHAQSIYWRL
jgi:hypothetical protein